MVDRMLASHLFFNAVYNDNERLSVDDEFYQKHQASYVLKIILSNDSIHCFLSYMMMTKSHNRFWC